MNEDDLKAVVAKYQQKSFEFFNQNIILEVQVEQLSKKVAALEEEILNYLLHNKNLVLSHQHQKENNKGSS